MPQTRPRDFALPVIAIGLGAIAAMIMIPAWIDPALVMMSGDKPKIFWLLGRTSAFISFAFLWMAMLLGLLMTNKLARIWPGGPVALDLHQFTSIAGLGFAVFHALILMGSKFLHYSLLDVFIPFHSDAYRQNWVGLGQVSLYGFAILIASFYVRRIITQRIWRALHFSSFLLFVTSMAHGLLTGTDTNTYWALALYGLAILSVTGLTLRRIGMALFKTSGRASALANHAPAGKTAQQQPAPMITPQDQPDRAPANRSSATQARTGVTFGSQSGNAEALAQRVSSELGARLIDGAALDLVGLQGLDTLLLISSTYGNGEAPDNITPFYDALHHIAAPQLPGLRYAVLALGDSGFKHFCKAGRDFDARLAALGAQRLLPVVTCDRAFELEFQTWLASLKPLLGAAGEPENSVVQAERLTPVALPAKAAGQPAVVLRNSLLTVAGDADTKQVRQIVFSLTGTGLKYEAGDALGVMPVNDPQVVAEIICATGFVDETPVPIPGGGEAPLSEALLRHYDVTTLTHAHIRHFADQTNNPRLQALCEPGNADALEAFLGKHHIVDLIARFPRAFECPAALVASLGELRRRLYSIASSARMHPSQVHLTVGVVDYASNSRRRTGVCSGDLQRSSAGTARRIVVQSNRGFRLPADGNIPVIMIGPGTGIAPFRAFLQERAATGAQGPNWLFFGCRHARLDYLYQDELQHWQATGVLNRLDVAFSRMQVRKVYVQDLIRQHAAELWRWLDQGAQIYVCGDASKMARDVDSALTDVAIQSGYSPEQAANWLVHLRRDKRYLRDVY